MQPPQIMTKVGYIRISSYPGSVYRHLYASLTIEAYLENGKPGPEEWDKYDVEYELTEAEAKKLNKQQTRPGEPSMYEPGMTSMIFLDEKKAVKEAKKLAVEKEVDLLFRGQAAMAIPRDVIIGPDEVVELFKDDGPSWSEWKPYAIAIKKGEFP